MSAITQFVPSVSQIKSAYIDHKMAMVSLFLVAATSFVAMVTNAYCANHINMSQCGQSDENAVKAHQWAMTSATLNAVTFAGSIAGVVYIIYRHMKGK